MKPWGRDHFLHPLQIQVLQWRTVGSTIPLQLYLWFFWHIWWDPLFLCMQIPWLRSSYGYFPNLSCLWNIFVDWKSSTRTANQLLRKDQSSDTGEHRGGSSKWFLQDGALHCSCRIQWHFGVSFTFTFFGREKPYPSYFLDVLVSNLTFYQKVLPIYPYCSFVSLALVCCWPLFSFPRLRG